MISVAGYDPTQYVALIHAMDNPIKTMLVYGPFRERGEARLRGDEKVAEMQPKWRPAVVTCDVFPVMALRGAVSWE